MIYHVSSLETKLEVFSDIHLKLREKNCIELSL